MRKWLVAGVVFLVIGLMIVLALLNLNSLIERNKDYLIAQAEQALGRRVSVGEVRVALWGGIGLRAKDFALSDDPSFHSGDFVRAGDLQINVKLLPLLAKKLEIKRLILHNPVIEIIRDKGGKFNFSGIGKGEREETRPERAPVEEGLEPAEKETPFLAIALADISNGTVHYLDQKERVDLRVRAIDFRAKEVGSGKPFPVELAAALFSENQNVMVEGKIGPLGQGGDFSQTPVDARMDIDPLDFTRLNSAVPKVNGALPRDLRLSGIFRIKDLEVKGTVGELALKGALEGTDAAIGFGDMLQKTPGVPLILSAEGQYGRNAMSLQLAKLTLHTLELTGKGELKWGDAVAVNLSLNTNRASFAGWDEILPFLKSYQLRGDFEVHTTVQGKAGKGATPQIQGKLTLSRASVRPLQLPRPIKDLNAAVRFTGRKAELGETSFSVGNSRIQLAAQITRFSPLALSYQLSSPEFHPVDFQPSVPDERKADLIRNLSSEGTLAAKDGDFSFEGKVASNQGTLYGIGYKDLAAVLSWENKTANIRSLRVNALNGSLEAEGEYVSDGAVPRFSLTSKVQGVDLMELYPALYPSGQQDIRGRLNADLKVSGRGKDWNAIKPNLRGQGRAEVVEGALLNFNLAEGVVSGITKVPGLTSLISSRVRQKYPEIFEAKDTAFKELSTVFELGGSRMNINDLRIAAADYAVGARGWADFARKVDFNARLLFSQRLSGDLAQDARDVQYIFNDRNQLEIPFDLTGTLPKVRPKPDSDYLVRLFQRGLARKGTEELKKRFFGSKESTEGEKSPESSRKEATEEMIRKGLEGLFSR